MTETAEIKTLLFKATHTYKPIYTAAIAPTAMIANKIVQWSSRGSLSNDDYDAGDDAK